MGKNRVGFGPCEKRLFLLCWTAYFATYICRLNFSAVMPELNTLGLFTKGADGFRLLLRFLLHYGVGQFINGFLGDRIAPRQMVFGRAARFRACAISCCFLRTATGCCCFFGG